MKRRSPATEPLLAARIIDRLRCPRGSLVLQSVHFSNQVLAHRRILVAEDEGLIALDLEAMLQGFGCEVIGPLSELPAILSAVRNQLWARSRAHRGG